MKAVKLILFVLLLILNFQFAYASVTLDSFPQQVYNLGDKIFVKGVVERADDTRAYLNLNLACESGTTRIASVLVDFDADSSQTFSQLVLIPSSVLGKCNVKGELIDSTTNANLESFTAEAFTVTSDLKGEFDITKQNLQLGDVLTIKGNIQNYGDVPIDGLGVIYFRNSANLSFADSTLIKNGLLDYSRDMGFVPPAKYVVDIKVSDNLGNSHFFENVFDLDVSGNILIDAGFTSKSYLPGDTIVLNGILSGLYENSLTSINLKFEFDDGEIVERFLADNINSFNAIHATAKDIKSGYHEVKIYAESDGGNYGFTVLNYSINPVATSLQVTATEESFLPEDGVGFNLVLLDQANDPMESGVVVSLLNDNKVVASSTFNANSAGSLLLPIGAKPGSWVLRAEALGLRNEQTITVEQYKKLDVEVRDDKLNVVNKGNVNYNSDLVVAANDLTGKKKLNLDVGEAQEISLGSLFPEGVYDVKVLDKEFKDVQVNSVGFFSGLGSITGNVAKNLGDSDRKVGFGFLILIILGCVLFVFLKKSGKLVFGKGNHFSEYSGKKYDEMRRQRDYEDGQKMADLMRRKGIRKDKPPMEFGKASQEDIEDFQVRMKGMFADQEEKEKEDKPKGGIMGMFG